MGIRLSPFNVFNSMPAYPETVQTYKTLVKKLNDWGILYLHVIESSARNVEKGQQLLTDLKADFEGLVIVNGGYSRASIEATLDANRADLVALGVPFLANPDLVHRLEHDLPLNSPNPETFYSARRKRIH